MEMNFVEFFIFFITIFYCQAAYYDNYNYCQLPCNYGLGDIMHIICQKGGDCSVDAYICQGYEPVVMTDKIKQLIIDENNILRNRVANGEEIRGRSGPQPPVANMRALKYNDELAHIAQCWANTCQISKHSNCHRAKRLPYVGQNIAYRQSTVKNFEPLEVSIKKMISLWYEEVALFNPRNIQPFKSINGYTIYMVCNYGSTEVAGNVNGRNMHQIGQPLSRCPPKTDFNRKYSGLCGNDTLDLTEYYTRPELMEPELHGYWYNLDV